MGRGQGGKGTGREGDTMGRGQEGKGTGWEGDRMERGQDGKGTRWERDRMRGRKEGKTIVDEKVKEMKRLKASAKLQDNYSNETPPTISHLLILKQVNKMVQCLLVLSQFISHCSHLTVQLYIAFSKYSTRFCIYVRTYVCVHMDVRMCACVCTSEHVYMCICGCTHVMCMDVCEQVYKCVCVHV